MTKTKALKIEDARRIFSQEMEFAVPIPPNEKRNSFDKEISSLPFVYT
jgi:hypothetical protein